MLHLHLLRLSLPLSHNSHKYAMFSPQKHCARYSVFVSCYTSKQLAVRIMAPKFAFRGENIFTMLLIYASVNSARFIISFMMQHNCQLTAKFYKTDFYQAYHVRGKLLL